MVCASGRVLYFCYVVLYKLKQKRQQRKANIAEPSVPKKQSECHRSKEDTMTDVSATTSSGLTASHKRKRTSDMHHDDDMPGKRLKFSSLFTNNPEIPHVDRYFALHCK